jgi:peptidoglycan/xylan/chitin deacetylase (PgdA/CDA1 family)
MADTNVCLTFDFDAVSVWIHAFDAADSPTKLSRGEYGAEVALPRILGLLDDRDLPATFFVPGHTADSFPEQVQAIHERGHDIQHHGWSHTHPRAFDSREAERADIVRGIESIEDRTGEAPTGYRSPGWDFSAHTLDLLRELGFDWDSSQMGRDFEPYRLRAGRSAPADGPYDPGTETDVLEFPVSWGRDDWPPLHHSSAASAGTPASDERAVFEGWQAQFEWAHEHVPGAVFSLTFHPQVIGQPPRLRYLGALLDGMAEADGVEFATFDALAAAY